MEYPKHLYMNADPEAADAIVRNAEEEAAKRAEGYRMAYEPQQESLTKKRGRKVAE